MMSRNAKFSIVVVLVTRNSICKFFQEEDAVTAFETRPITPSEYDDLVIVSDGILEQIGGPKRLFLVKQLVWMISDTITTQDNSSQTGHDQAGGDYTGGAHINESALRESIRQYQAENEQRDDMTLVILPCGALPGWSANTAKGLGLKPLYAYVCDKGLQR